MPRYPWSRPAGYGEHSLIPTGEGYVEGSDWEDWYQKKHGTSWDDFDWWDMPPEAGDIGPRNRYEDILESLRMRSIADPGQEAISFGADVSSGSHFGFLDDLYKAAGANLGRGGTSVGGINKSEALRRLASEGSPLLGMIGQQEGMRSQIFPRAASGALGPATSMVGQGYQGLQNYRGQDQQRYLTEMQLEAQMKMQAMQAKMMAAMQGGGFDWMELLGTLGGVAGNVLPWVL